ncbi:MAG TPA: ABC transporter ATP-binding protein [Tepidisphaeraceae bacterium]|jgi:ABC-2 type transport system ATP-binding protein|nr:ABC transporter ATP-binding protein [Tepidisphaeraceae bacterium]
MHAIAPSIPAAPTTATVGTTAVSIEDLSYAYGDRTAIDNLSLQVPTGEIFGLLGPNGSGKTTLFRVLSTLIPPQSGKVTVLGHNLATDRDCVRRDIGVVFQSPALDKQLTAYENLACQAALYGLSGPVMKERIETLLAAVNLLDRAHERTDRFSGGMRRRVEIAKGLLHRPKLLILDEPSTGLDPGARLDLWQLLNDIRAQQDVTILLTTHLMEEADLCDRLAILMDGRLLACDSPAALKGRIRGEVITLTSAQPDALRDRLREKLGIEMERVGDALRLQRPRGHEFVPALIEAAPGLVDSVSVGRPSLADVFVELTGRNYRSEVATPNRGAEPQRGHR